VEAAKQTAAAVEAVAAAEAAEAADVTSRGDVYRAAAAAEGDRIRRLRQRRQASRTIGGGFGLAAGVGAISLGSSGFWDVADGVDESSDGGGAGGGGSPPLDTGFMPHLPDAGASTGSTSPGAGAPSPRASLTGAAGGAGGAGTAAGGGLVRRRSEPFLLAGGKGAAAAGSGAAGAGGGSASAGGGAVGGRAGAGTVYTWGCGDMGQLGDGRLVPDGAPRPVRVEAFKSTTKGMGAVDCAAGLCHAAVITTSLQLWTWGDNSASQCGLDGDRAKPVVKPTLVPALKAHRVLAVAAGATHTLALVEGGVVWSWGSGPEGQLGGGPTLKAQYTPARITSVGPDKGSPFAAVAAGRAGSAAITPAGDVYVWGSNAWGQLGLGPAAATGKDAAVWAPVKVAALTGRRVDSVALGDTFTAWTVDDGELLVAGALGVTSDAWTARKAFLTWPHVTATFAHRPVVTRIAAGREHLALVADCGVYLAGRGWLGGSFGGDVAEDPVPVEELDMEGIVDVSAGGMHTLARSLDGRLFGIGANVTGVLAAGHTADASHPIPALSAEEGGHYAAVASGADFGVGIVVPGVPVGFVSSAGIAKGGKSITALLREPATVPPAAAGVRDASAAVRRAAHTPPLCRVSWRPSDSPSRTWRPLAGSTAGAPVAAKLAPAVPVRETSRASIVAAMQSGSTTTATAAAATATATAAAAASAPDLPTLPTTGFTNGSTAGAGGGGHVAATPPPPPAFVVPPAPPPPPVTTAQTYVQPPPPPTFALPAPPPAAPAPAPAPVLVAASASGSGSDASTPVDAAPLSGVQRLHAKAQARRTGTGATMASTPTSPSSPAGTAAVVNAVTGLDAGTTIGAPASGASDGDASAILPAGWERYQDDEGDSYFFCTATGEATWLLFWELRDSDGTPYYVNCETQASQWDRPADAVIVTAVE